MRLRGKTAIITGAGSGIGRALAVEIAGRGGFSMLVGRRPDALEETLALLPGDAPAYVLPVDVTLAADRRLLGERALEVFGALDLLINNAGVIAAAPFAATPDAAMERMLATNVMAPFALTRELLPLLRSGDAPRVVNIGSLLGEIALPQFAGYAATKFGLRGLSDALRRELRPLGIGVTHIAARATRTEAAPKFAHLVEPMGMKLDDPQVLARRIVDAVERERRSLYPVGAERLFLFVQRLWPALVDRAVNDQAATLQGPPATHRIPAR